MSSPQLAQFNDVSLLLMRLMIGVVFFPSGWRHLHDLKKTAASRSG